MQGDIGTIIHGTLRVEDLLPAFADELERLDESGEHTKLIKEAKSFDFEGNDDEEAAYWIVDELANVLNEFAPEGCYFGVNEGDGSDFGFWEEINWSESKLMVDWIFSEE